MCNVAEDKRWVVGLGSNVVTLAARLSSRLVFLCNSQKETGGSVRDKSSA